jgi:hypothetical protein
MTKTDKRATLKPDKRTKAKADRRDSSAGVQTVFIVGYGIIGVAKISA